jgi:hypothetical protein
MKAGSEVGLGAGPRRNAFSVARVLGGILLTVLVLQISAPPSASAGTFTVRPCNGKSNALSILNVEPRAFRVTDDCSRFPVTPGIGLESDATFTAGAADTALWFFNTPGGGLSLAEVSMNLDFTGAWATTPLTWEARGDNQILEQAGRGGTRTPSDGLATYIPGSAAGPGKFPAGAKSFSIGIACRQTSCARGPSVGVLARDIRVVLEDPVPPAISNVGGTLLGPGAQQGTRTVTLTGADDGSGVFSSEVLVDGIVVSTIRNLNGGRCTVPFEVMVPCVANDRSTHQIDTTALVDGGHSVAVRVCDGAANCAVQGVGATTVRNAPTNVAPPTLSGAAKVSSTLASQPGDWQGLPSEFSRQWLRCPATVTSATEADKCAPIAAATGTQYVPVKADVGQRAMVRETATLFAAGHASSSATSAPSDVVADLPAAPGPAPVGPGAGGPPPVAQSNPPQTQLKKRPRKKTALRATRFTFGSDQAGARFECKLDKRPFRSCGSTFKKKLKPGAHVFRVRAVNSAGQVDATPAVFRWKIQAAAPRLGRNS